MAGEERAGGVDRYVVLKREKERLRRERDRMLLDLSDTLGRDGMANALGLEPAQAAGLLERAQERLLSSDPRFSPGMDTPVRARRGRARAGGPARGRDPVAADRAPVVGRHGERRRSAPAAVAWTDADAYYHALGVRALERDHWL
jgi:hypothetical protein